MLLLGALLIYLDSRQRQPAPQRRAESSGAQSRVSEAVLFDAELPADELAPAPTSADADILSSEPAETLDIIRELGEDEPAAAFQVRDFETSPLPRDDLAIDPQDEASPGRDNQVREPDRKSTRLNSSHLGISYAV